MSRFAPVTDGEALADREPVFFLTYAEAPGHAPIRPCLPIPRASPSSSTDAPRPDDVTVFFHRTTPYVPQRVLRDRFCV